VIAEAKSETLLETIMRFSPAAIALSLTLAVISSAGISKPADDQIDPLSITTMKQGDSAMAKADYPDAIDWYETALAVDPRNRNAYIQIARASRAQGMLGKTIRYYKEALEIEPNDQLALAEQAEAMAAKGAIASAKTNLARLRMLCQTNCSRVDAVATAIDTAGKKPQMQASAVEIKPVVTSVPEKKN
jgi:tetratricopeptide (TPR) repeat protein